MSAIRSTATLPLVPSKRAQTIPAPAWWVREVIARVQTGRGRRRADDPRIPQTDLAERIRLACGATYHPSEISRAVLGEVLPIDLAQQISAALELPAPVYLAESIDQADALAAARDQPDLILRLLARHVSASGRSSEDRSPSQSRERTATSEKIADDPRARAAKEIIFDRLHEVSLRRRRQPRPVQYADNAGAKPGEGEPSEADGNRPRRSDRRDR